MANPISEFSPLPIIDITTIRFCTYCFKATDTANVHIKKCPMKQFSRAIPDFWPPHWELLKSVNFKYNVCYVPGCEKPVCAEKGTQLVKHLNIKHGKNQFASFAVPESKITSSDSTILSSTKRLQANTYRARDANDPMFQPPKVMCAKDIRTKSSAIQGQDRRLSIGSSTIKTDETGENGISMVAGIECETSNFRDGSFSQWKYQISDGVYSEYSCNQLKSSPITSSSSEVEKDKEIGCNDPCKQPTRPSKIEVQKVEKVEMVDCKDCIKDKIKCLPDHTEHDLPAPSSKRMRTSLQFTCGHCKFTTCNPQVIKMHYRLNHQTKLLYLCEPCFFVSHCKYTYQTHWKSYHSESPPLEIKPLDLEYLDSEEVNKHAEADDTDSISDLQELVEHNEQNHNKYLFSKVDVTVDCKFCSFKTLYSHSMKKHVASHHYTAICETLVNTADDTRTYRCITCATVTQSKQGAANHHVSSHIDFPVVSCELCEVNFKDKGAFFQHVKTEMHREYYRRSLRCPNCQFATLSKKALQKHKALTHKIVSESIKKFACDKCDFKAAGLGQLNAHKKKVHEFVKDENGLYKCDECEFSTLNKDKLLAHKKTAPDHSIAKKCVRCDLCDFAALNINGLNYHKSKIHGIIC